MFQFLSRIWIINAETRASLPGPGLLVIWVWCRLETISGHFDVGWQKLWHEYGVFDEKECSVFWHRLPFAVKIFCIYVMIIHPKCWLILYSKGMRPISKKKDSIFMTTFEEGNKIPVSANNNCGFFCYYGSYGLQNPFWASFIQRMGC